MKKRGSLNQPNSFKSLLIFLLIIYGASLYGQTSVNFSGLWVMNNAKSDDFYKSFDLTYNITQTPLIITIKQTFFDKSGKEAATRDNSFNLDGKEVNTEEQGGTNKESAIWSNDKKTLTTKSTRTVGKDVYGSTATYSLSDDGLVLTVKISDVNPMGPSVTLVLNKKLQ